MLSITGWHTIYRTDLHFIIPVILNQLRRQNLRLFLPIHHAQVNSHGTALNLMLLTLYILSHNTPYG